MGLFRKFFRDTVGVGSKLLMNAANAASGGLVGKVADAATHTLSNNSGLIGKTMSGLGKAFLSDKTRGKLSGIADAAIKYIPKGNVRDALTKINNHAQGRDENYKVKSKAITTTATTPQKQNNQIAQAQPYT